MTIEDLFDYSKLSINDQRSIIGDKVSETELDKIRSEIQNLYTNNSKIFYYSKPQLEVFLYELIDKITHTQNSRLCGAIVKPYLTNRLLENEISHYEEYLSEKHIDIVKAKEEDIKQYIFDCLKNNKSISQVRITLSQIKKYYDLLLKDNPGMIFNPCENIKINKDMYETVKKVSIPTDTEIEIILNSLPPYYAAITALMCVKGYSHRYIKSIQSIDLENGDYDLDIIYKDESHYHFAYIKNFVSNSDYYPAWYKKIALIYHEKADEFSNQEFVPRNFENYLQKIVSSLCEQEKLSENYTAKSFRHYCIKKIYETTQDESLICKILEHTNLTTTRVYLRDLGLMKQKQ